MRVIPIPMLRDNYAYLIADDEGDAAVVDPADAAVVERVLAVEGVRLRAVLNTHHHPDHTAGNVGLLERRSTLEIYGPSKERERIPGLTHALLPGEIVRIGRLEGHTLDVACHTRGHVAYVFGDAVFTGDTLFAGGCGRFFEGSAEDMYRALYEVIAGLPDESRIYCGHEYTQKNLEFARLVEPENEAVAVMLEETRVRRARNEPTVPTRLADEKNYNPFLRVHVEAVAAQVARRFQGVSKGDPVQVLAALRRWKDDF